MTVAFVIIALGQTVPVVLVGWCLAQLGANATLAPFIATISDQVPKFQRGSVSALLGIAQNVGILGGTYLAQIFADQLVILFVVPSIFAIGAMLLFAFILPDQHLTVKPPRMTAGEWISTLWVNPRKYPDFAFAWWSRFLITLATFMFTAFRLFYMQDRLGLSLEDAPAAVSLGVLIYTIALVASGWVAGKISDRIGSTEDLRGGVDAVVRGRHRHVGVRRLGDRVLRGRGGAGLGVRHLRGRRPRAGRRCAAQPRRRRQGPRRVQHGQRPAAERSSRTRGGAARLQQRQQPELRPAALLRRRRRA